MDLRQWLIWSREHQAFWISNHLGDSSGYTNDLDKAARYTLSEAAKICESCNEFVKEGEALEEHYFPAPESFIDLLIKMIDVRNA